MREQEQHAQSTFINVKIKTLNSSIYDIIANPVKTIRSFQYQVEQKTAVPVSSQRLLYRGFVLDPDKRLADYRIEEGNIIQLIANKIPSQHSHHSSLKRSEINKANSYKKEHSKTKKYRQLQERLTGFRIKKDESIEVLQQNKQTIDQLIQCLNHNFIQDVNPFKIERRKLQIGQWIDVRDASGQWIQGQVVNKYGEYVFIHYNGLHTRWNQWISVSSQRIMPFRSHTVQLVSKSPYMSPFPSYEREIQTKSNSNFQSTIQTLIYQTTHTLDNLSSLMKQLQLTAKDFLKDESLNNVSHLEVPDLRHNQGQFSNVSNEQNQENEVKECQTPGKDSVVIGDNISNKCEDDNRSIKYDNDDVSSKKSYKSKRSEGLVDTASMKSLTIDQSTRKRQNKVFFDRPEEAQSVRSGCPKKYNRNFYYYNQQFIPEETPSQFDDQQFQQAALFHKKQLKRKMKASQLAPLLDRMGRFLIDIAPHFALLGHTDQLVNSSFNENLSTYTNEGSLLSKLSDINKCVQVNNLNQNDQNVTSGKDQNNEQQKINAFCSFQIPLMLTPNEVIKMDKLIEAEKRNLHLL